MIDGQIVPEEQVIMFLKDSNRIEGVRGLGKNGYEAVSFALHFLAKPIWTISDLIDFVQLIEPKARYRDLPHVHNVRVGNYHAPESGYKIAQLMQTLYAQSKAKVTNLAHFEHIRYQQIHPFTDGNGRSGRLLWLWTKLNIEKDMFALQRPFLQSWYYDTLKHAG